MKKFLLICCIPLLAISCQTENEKNNYNLEQEHQVMSTIWFQNSPEAKSLYYQGFNIAKERVLEFKSETSEKPQAVVVDLDETMINNSPFQGKMIETGKGFSPEFWNEWSAQEKATALPGAREFTHFCDSVGIQIIYLSNRMVTELEWTMNNLKDLDFAYVEPDNFLLKDTISGKEARREVVSEDYDIILLLGDNLNDFSEVFENRGDDWGASIVDEYREEFGRRFIVFPNPMYGEWEKSIYNHKRDIDDDAKFMMRRESIEAY
ncbi:MAG: 5'-nucleotidase, lipoprotein e(P4) family [Bacteroidales bacterium]